MEISNKHLLVATIATVLSSGAVQGMDMSNHRAGADSQASHAALSWAEVRENTLKRFDESLRPDFVEGLSMCPDQEQKQAILYLYLELERRESLLARCRRPSEFSESEMNEIWTIFCGKKAN